MKLLIVDGEAVYREVLSLCAQTRGLETKAVSLASEAITAFQDWKPDIVVLEVLLEDGEGFQVASEIKSLSGESFVPVIFLTTKTDDATMNRCVKAGGDDFIPKPFSEVLFNTRLSAHLRNVSLTREMYRKNRDLMYYQSMIEREHNMAHQVLSHAMKRSQDNDPKVAVTRRSATSFNGDLALVSRRHDGTLLAFVGDFTGHGLPASIGALPITQTFFEAADRDLAHETLARTLNHVLNDILPDYMFCAAYILLLDGKGRLSYWGGGMPEGYLVRSGQVSPCLVSRHMPLGILADNEFEDGFTHVQLQAGDRLVLGSDGVVELNNSKGDMYGAKRLQEEIQHSYAEGNLQCCQSRLLSALTEFQDGAEQLDDITLLSIEY